MTQWLNIAEKVKIDIGLMTRATAILANRGAGKTYTASVIAEELLSLKQQVICIDPVGVMWGLKSGFSIPIFGGEHQDLPLSPAAGEELARAVVEHRFSCILDTSDMSNSDTLRFVGSFLHELYRLKARHRESCFVIVDEADMFAPQGATSGHGPTCLGAMQFLVRRGRARGLGCALVTQRPQAIAKDVLTQCEVLIAMRMSHNLDIGAVKLWMQSQASTSEMNTVIDSLPSLPTGEAWFWAPILDVFKRAKVRKRNTFDSSATPEPGTAAAEPKQLQAVDLEKLGKQIAATLEEKRANDPATLKAKIRELEKNLVKEGRPVPNAADHSACKQRANELEAAIGRIQTWERATADESLRQATFAKDRLEQLVKDATRWQEWAQERVKGKPDSVQPRKAMPAQLPAAHLPIARHLEVAPQAFGDRDSLPSGEAAVLRVLAQYPGGLDRGRIGIFSGFTARSTRNAYIQRLQTKGYASRSEPITITKEGVAAVGDFEPLPEGRELFEWWLAKLPEGERKMLEILGGGEDLSREDLGRLAGYEARSTRNAYIQRLAQKNLVDVNGNMVMLAEGLR